jgi:hypothetical protein
MLNGDFQFVGTRYETLLVILSGLALPLTSLFLTVAASVCLFVAA